jgi:uncharacterized protein (DUF305 family)
MRKKIVASILLGVVPLTLAACSGATSQKKAETTNANDSRMAQMGDGAMSSPGSSSPMPSSPMVMDSGSMMNMDLGPKDANFDLRFIDGMTPHHEGAIAMAQEALQKSKRPEIKQLAQNIIDAQQTEIAQMKTWRSTWYSNSSTTPMMYDAQMGHMMPMSEAMRSSMMMSGDLGAADDQFDLRFLNAMIPHHQGAVTMAQQALEKSDRPEVKKLAQDIVDSQQKEIDQMNQWKKAWYK